MLIVIIHLINKIIKNMSYFNSRKETIKQKNHIFIYIYILFLLNNILANSDTITNRRNLENYHSEIYLIVQGNGTQNLLNKSASAPSKVLVNGIENHSCNKTCNLEGDKNNITLIFEYKITTCQNMFRELRNILEIDLSNFDTSNINNMYAMFYRCTDLVLELILEILILL